MATTGWKLPTANHDDNSVEIGFDTTPEAPQTDDPTAAYNSGSGAAYWFYHGFDFSAIQSGDTINSVTIRARARDSTDAAGWRLGFKWAAITDASKNVVANYTGNETDIPGTGAYASDYWSDTTTTAKENELAMVPTLPTADELISTHFRLLIRVIPVDSYPQDMRLEALWLNVDYTSSGTSIPQGSHGIHRGINPHIATRLGGVLET